MRKKLLTIFILILSIILTIIAYIFDSQIIKYIQSIHNFYLDYFFIIITIISDKYIILSLLTLLLILESKKRRWIFPLWLTGFLAMGIGYILKSSIRRLRPFQQEPTVIFKSILYTIQNNYATWNFSFPSFHAMFVFSLLPLLNKQYSKFKYVWIIFAILVAFSRVYLGVHYLSDVLAGAIIGYLIGVSALWIEERYEIGYIIMKGLRVSK